MEDNKQTTEIKPVEVKGSLAYIIKNARESEDWFNDEKAAIAEGLAALRYLREEVTNSDLVKSRIDKIEGVLYDQLYYMGLMESEDGTAI